MEKGWRGEADEWHEEEEGAEGADEKKSSSRGKAIGVLLNLLDLMMQINYTWPVVSLAPCASLCGHIWCLK